MKNCPKVKFTFNLSVLHNQKKKENSCRLGVEVNNWMLTGFVYPCVCGVQSINIQRCSTIIKFNICMEASNTTKSFHFHVWPSLSLVSTFWNSILQVIPLFIQPMYVLAFVQDCSVSENMFKKKVEFPNSSWFWMQNAGPHMCSY